MKKVFKVLKYLRWRTIFAKWRARRPTFLEKLFIITDVLYDFDITFSNTSSINHLRWLPLKSVRSSMISVDIKCLSHKKIFAFSIGFQLSRGTRAIHLALRSGSRGKLNSECTSFVMISDSLFFCFLTWLFYVSFSFTLQKKLSS